MLRNLKLLVVLFIFTLSSLFPYHEAKAKSSDLMVGLDKEIQQYIKPWQGNITVHYKNLISNVGYSLNSQEAVRAASTIKLPLALYVMKLAESGKINLKEKLTYQEYHYYGGSGVIQNSKVGTQYTIEELVEKAMVYSDNIAFIMLKEKIGQNAFIQFMKDLGGMYTYPQGKNLTSAYDLSLYAKNLYQYSQKSTYGKKLVEYLKHTIYNTTIPKGISGLEIAHKVGMIPNEQIYNDIAIVYAKQPYTLAVTTKNLPYEKSQQVIAKIASIVNQYHQNQMNSSSPTKQPSTVSTEQFFKTKEEVTIYDNSTGKLVPIGEMNANQVFTRIRDYGNWHEIAVGNRKGYVWEKSTTLLKEANNVLFKKETSLGKITLNMDATIYDNSTKTLIPIATVLKGQTIEYTQKFGNWYGVILGERKGYIHKKAVTEVDESIRLTFAGDAMMDWSIKNTIKQKGVDYPFLQVKKEVSKSDLAVVNLETAITTTANKYPKEYNFKSAPASLTGLKNAGFDLVSIANNHSMDYQTVGLKDTLSFLKKYKLDYVGGGLNASEAYAAKTYKIKGKTIKLLAFSRVLPSQSWVATSSRPGLVNGYDLSLVTKAISKEKKNADFVFVYIHWGVETNRKPELFQQQWAKSMINAGADGVIGSHPHVLQGFEYYKGKPIAYSLGNFLFPDYVKGDKAQTAILHLDINGTTIGMTISPYKIYKDQIITQTEKEKQSVWKDLELLSYGNIKIRNGKLLY
ncbi:CapA family protein [Neobacillus sp. D3-1R]|uniref:CapA family protein n=1 Tax=Neobacillus sp. D3-1R TaxID=3445778 RepID=UPI003FA06FA5